MTHHTRKLHQALLDIGHQVEKDNTAPTIEQIKDMFTNYLITVKEGSIPDQKKAVDKLLAGLVRWEIEKL